MIKNQTPTPKIEPIPTSHKLCEQIRQNYLRGNSIKRILNEEKRFPIEHSYINLSLLERKAYEEKEKQLKSQEKKASQERQHDNHRLHHNEVIGTFEEIYGTKTAMDVKHIFAKCNDQIKKVLVLGRAGIGKSTFCQYVTYRWAKGELWPEFKLVVLIQLRKLTNSRYSSSKKYSMIDIVEREYFACEDLTKDDRQFFKERCCQGQVLWILDGYDEFVQNIPEQLKDVFEYIYQTQNHILTSRPYAITLAYDVKMEITGFTDDNIERYAKQFFDHIKNKMKNALPEGEKLLIFLKSNPSIWGIAHIPVNLELVCTLWGDTDWSEAKTLTMTELYDNITEILCRHYLGKQNVNHRRSYTINENLLASFKRTISLANDPLIQNKLIELIDAACRLDSFCLSFGGYKEIRRGDDPLIRNELHKLIGTGDHLIGKSIWNFITELNISKPLPGLFSRMFAQFKYDDTFWTSTYTIFKKLCAIDETALTDELMEILTSALYDKKHIAGCNAWDLLNNLGEKAATPKMLACLINIRQDASMDIPSEACRALGAMGEKAAIQEVIEAIILSLQSGDPWVRGSACWALGNICKKAVTPGVIAGLVNALGDENADVRQNALEALAKMGEKAPQNKIISRLIDIHNGRKLNKKRHASETLSNMDTKVVMAKFIAELRETLGDEDSNIVCEAYETLINMGKTIAKKEVIDVITDALCDENVKIRTQACFILTDIGEKVFRKELIIGLMDALSNQDYKIREKAYKCFEQIANEVATDEVIDILVKALYDKNYEARFNACVVISEFGKNAGTNEVLTGLVKVLQDDYLSVVRAACKALENIGEKGATDEVVNGLIKELLNDYWDERESACHALIKMVEKSATNEVIIGLAQALRDIKPEVRILACEALGKIGEKAARHETIAALIDALHDKESKVRALACNVLEKMNGKAATHEAIIGLMDALQDKEQDVRVCACKALGGMGEKVATTEVITALMTAMDDRSSYVLSAAAAKALANMGEKTATREVTTCLINALKGSRPVFLAVFDKIMHSPNAVQELDSNTLSTLYSYMKDYSEINLTGIPFDRFIKVFLETRNNAWLPLIVYAALLKVTAITIIHDKMIIYDDNGFIELHVSSPDLMTAMVKAFKEQKNETNDEPSTDVLDTQQHTKESSTICEIM
ncbi:unnamed protein product [Rotaria sp. Silwood2]|nr:unnamed protein product [Rotaria sp. Silwood2]